MHKLRLPPVRMNDRLTLKETLDRYAQRLEANRQALDMSRLYSRAYEMLASPVVRNALFGSTPARMAFLISR